jgi:hypothetical protein
MQTFLPYADYAKSARVLDNKRLGKQRSECLQILRALTLPKYGWKNHTATRMWRGHEQSLAQYSVAICDEWIARGYKDTCRQKIIDQIGNFLPDQSISIAPSWLGNEEIHASHRSNLLRKAPEWYSQFNWSEPNDLEYVWPV